MPSSRSSLVSCARCGAQPGQVPHTVLGNGVVGWGVGWAAVIVVVTTDDAGSEADDQDQQGEQKPRVHR